MELEGEKVNRDGVNIVLMNKILKKCKKKMNLQAFFQMSTLQPMDPTDTCSFLQPAVINLGGMKTMSPGKDHVIKHETNLRNLRQN